MTASAVSQQIGFDVSDGVAVLELRRPDKRNAVSWEMWETILTHLDAASERTDVRVLVVQGSGGAFCAGADLTAVKDRDGSASPSFRQLVVQAVTAVAEFPVPSVACVDGPCIGAGCSIALACDIRLANPDSTFAIPAVRHGIVYDEDSIARLVALVGPSRAARILYTGQRLDGMQAERIGLVDECSPNLERLLDDCVAALASADPRNIAAHRKILRVTASRIEGHEK